MSDAEFVLRSTRVVLPEGERRASIHVSRGKIAAVAAYDDAPNGWPVVDARDAAVLPGVVDSHVHVNEPGRTEWEGFATATRAAAVGGVTSLVDMPLNSIPPTTTREAFAAKRAAAAGQCAVDVGFWAGAGRDRKASFVFVGPGWKLIPSSAKNSINESRTPFSTAVFAKLRSLCTIASMAEDFLSCHGQTVDNIINTNIETIRNFIKSPEKEPDLLE